VITVVGDVMADVVARVDGPLARGSDTPATVMLRGGGAAGNVAAWLGERARLVARVGDDAMAPVALGGLRGAVVDPARPTGVCVVIVGPDGERTMLPDPGANAMLEPPSGPVDAEVVYVSGYALMRKSTRAAARAWLAAARGRTAVDPASAALIAVTPEAFEDLRVDLLLPNEDEAAVLGERCFAIAGEVVTKRGAAGAEWSDGTRVLRTGPAAAAVRDTTGAGDAFAAGFLAAWPEGPERALEAGTACAGRALAGPGSRP
jgi:sugar/nucleoside kinase (ribokinase family)